MYCITEHANFRNEAINFWFKQAFNHVFDSPTLNLVADGAPNKKLKHSLSKNPLTDTLKRLNSVNEN